MAKPRIFINKNIWNSFDDVKMDWYVNQVFHYYRQSGFPYFPTNKSFRDSEFNKLMKYRGNLVNDKTIKQTMHGLSLAWSYMPHSWGVQCGETKTPLEAFENDDTFKKVIRKRIQMGDNMSDNGIRKMLKMFTGVQSVSNFRPTAASAVYDLFCDKGDTVLDMSSGYGGRLLGAIKSGVNYIGIEPCIATYNGLCEIANDYGKDIDIDLINSGSETDYTLQRIKANYPNQGIKLAFTSPPYFNHEKYDNDAGQSWVRFPTKEDWIEGFLGDTFKTVYDVLHDDGTMVINIADVPSFPNLVNETIRVAEEAGFVYTDMMRLSLSNPSFRNKTSAYKYEPVLVFKKCSLH